MKVAVFLNHRFYRVNDKYFCDLPNLLDLFDALQQQAGTLVLCAPTSVVEEPPRWVQPLVGGFEVQELPFYRNHMDLIRRLPQLGVLLLKRILPKMREWDVVAGMAPSGFGLMAVLAAILLRRRAFMIVRGNVVASLREEYGSSRGKRLLVLTVLWPLHLLTQMLARVGLPTFTFGPLLAQIYRGPNAYVLQGHARRSIAGNGSQAVSNPEQLYRMLYVGRLTGEKGVDVLLRALDSIQRGTKSAVLTIVGDGSERPELERLADELGIRQSVTFLPYVKEPEKLRQIYLEHGVLILPSRTEGVPNVLLEGQALGRVIVASRVGGIPSVLRDNENGLLVEPDNPTALASAVQWAQSNPEHAMQLAASSLRSSQSHSGDREARLILEKVGVSNSESKAS